jgi:hypothetical protein
VTLNPKKSPLAFTFYFCSLILFIAFALPIWDVWILDGVMGNVMEVLEWAPFEPDSFMRFHRNNLIRLVIVVVIGAGIGRLTHWLIWGRESNPSD